MSTIEAACLQATWGNSNATNDDIDTPAGNVNSNFARLSGLRVGVLGRGMSGAGTQWPIIASAAALTIPYYATSENWAIETLQQGGNASPTVSVMGTAKIHYPTATNATRKTQLYMVPWEGGVGPASNVQGDIFFDSGVMVGNVGLYEHDGTNFYRVRPTLSTTATTATIAGTVTTETTLKGTAVGTTTIPANTFTIAGKTLRLKASGYYSTDAAPATLNIKFKWGSTILAQTTAITPPASQTNAAWRVECEVTNQTAGASATAASFTQGVLHLYSTAGAVAEHPMSNNTTVAIDTVNSAVIDLTSTWGSSVAADTISCSNMSLEVLN